MSKKQSNSPIKTMLLLVLNIIRVFLFKFQNNTLLSIINIIRANRALLS